VSMLVCSMFRTTITLPEELAAILSREAKRRDSSVSAIVRDAVGSFLGLDNTKARRLPFAALGRSGRRHTARNAETILARAWSRADRR
jgi:predicted transcriptional regulator